MRTMDGTVLISRKEIGKLCYKWASLTPISIIGKLEQIPITSDLLESDHDLESCGMKWGHTSYDEH